MKSIAGTKEVLAKLAMIKDEIVERVATATEITAVQVSVEAASGHKRGFAHTVGRYENQTTTLTRSLLQAPVPEQVDADEVRYAVGSNIEDAYDVEVRYPYLWPAAVAHKQKFRDNIAEALS